MVALVAICVVLFVCSIVYRSENNESDKIGTVAVAVGVVSAIIALVQLWLAERQQQIIERQDAELRQKARLVMWAMALPEDWEQLQRSIQSTMGLGVGVGTPQLSLSIANVGTRTARECTIIVLSPEGFFSNESLLTTRWQDRGTESHQGESYERWEIPLWDWLFFPNHVVRVPYTMLADSSQVSAGAKLFYRLLYADDSTPSATGFSRLTTREHMRLEDLPRGPA